MGHFSYPTDKMRLTAQKVRTSADTAMANHGMYWRRVQNCLSPLPGFLQSALSSVLDPHDKRLRDSYQWQLDFATALEQAADRMDGLDQQIKQTL
ncbi:MAG TPA: hypothetical protein VGF67_09670 [Ktedonobacteraceae bacterium]|jgi:hypothetical protein